MTFRVAGLPHIDDPHVGVGRMRGDPVGVDELLGMGVRHGQDSKHVNHAGKFSAQALQVST